MKSPSKSRVFSTFRSVAIITNPDKFRAYEELPRLRSWLKKRRITVLPAPQLSRADLVVTLGGDGTILGVATRAALAGIPVLGVNIGRLGFMTGVELSRMYEALSEVLETGWVISERLMMDVTVPRSQGPHLALNDAVIRIGSSTRVTTVNAKIENEDLGSFTGDGLIVATPTGSTAYSLAAQGPIVHAEMEAFVLTPICPHGFTQRPVVFPAYYRITLWSDDRRAGNELQLCLDGHRAFRLRPDETVIVRCSRHKLKLLQKPDISYFGVLRDKLSWGGR